MPIHSSAFHTGVAAAVIIAGLLAGETSADENIEQSQPTVVPVELAPGEWVLATDCGFIITRTSFEKLGNPSDEMTPFKRGDRWGYIDNDGVEVVAPRFRLAQEFSSGMAAVQDTATGRWGYIDFAGDYIIQPSWGLARPFHGKLAVVATHQYNHLRLIDRSGEYIDDRRWTSVVQLEDGSGAGCEQLGQCYIFDRDGTRTHDLPLERPMIRYTGGEWIGTRSAYYHHETGEQLPRQVTGNYSPAEALNSSGLTRVSRFVDGNLMYGYIDSRGDIKIPLIFRWASPFCNDHAMVRPVAEEDGRNLIERGHEGDNGDPVAGHQDPLFMGPTHIINLNGDLVHDVPMAYPINTVKISDRLLRILYLDGESGLSRKSIYVSALDTWSVVQFKR